MVVLCGEAEWGRDYFIHWRGVDIIVLISGNPPYIREKKSFLVLYEYLKVQATVIRMKGGYENVEALQYTTISLATAFNDARKRLTNVNRKEIYLVHVVFHGVFQMNQWHIIFDIRITI